MTVMNMDCIEGMRLFPDAYFDSIVTDPPYELGFMGKGWDSTGIANSVEMWAEALRVLKPGGHLLAFSGSRTYHRMVCAIEDAGFEIRDQIMWVYGSGFPKSLDVSKAIDKRGGNTGLTAEIGAAIKAARFARNMTAGECDQLFCGGSTNWSWFEGRVAGQRAPTPDTFARIVAHWPELAAYAEAVAEADREVTGQTTKARSTSGASALPTVGGQTVYQTWNETAPATDAARQWQGWGTALKPAHEPIVVARKPLIGTVAANVLAHGTGAINVDGCRVPLGADKPYSYPNGRGGQGWHGRESLGTNLDVPVEGSAAGRWPANLIHDGSDEVLAAFPQDAGRFYYAAKASRSDRNSGLDGIEEVIIEPFGDTPWGIAAREVRLLVDTAQSPPRVTDAFGTPLKNAIEWSTMLFGNEPTGLSHLDTMCTTETKINSTTGLTTLSYFQRFVTNENTADASSINPASGGNLAENAATSILSMSTTNARMASALGVDLAALPMRLKISVGAMRSDHPTVKPTALMRYLCRLVTPPGGTVLDPFTGSGSTGKAAALEGFGFIGFELSAEYAAIAIARITEARK